MDEKKPKSREEWKKIINNLSPPSFQNLCYDLLRNLGFVDIKRRGEGSDGGRDIRACFSRPLPNGDAVNDTCWISCKKQKEGVSWDQIIKDVSRADNDSVEQFILMSNSETTSPCQDEIKKWNGKKRCQIIDWTGLKFQDILFRNQDTCKYYFSDEEVPPSVDVKKPEEAIALSTGIGKQLGIDLEFRIGHKVNLSDPKEVAEVLKEALLKLKDVDVNIRALIYHRVSMLFFGLGYAEDALLFLDKSLEIAPRNIEALLNKGFVLGKINDIDKSNKCFDAILAFAPDNKFALNNKAINLMGKGLFKDALPLADKALEIDPGFINAIVTKVNVLKGLKKSKDALKFLNDRNDLVKKSIDLKTEEVNLYIDRLDLKRAYKINEGILSKDPNNLAAMNNKGVIFEKNSRFQYTDKYLPLAMRWFEKVLEKDDKYPLGLSNKVVVLVNSNQIEEAERIMDYARKLLPGNPYILNKAGVVLLAKKKPKPAADYFDAALKLRFNEEFLLNKAQANLDQNHSKEAKDAAEDLLRYNPEKSEAWKIKGLALEKMHQRSRASICFRKAEEYKDKPISLLEN